MAESARTDGASDRARSARDRNGIRCHCADGGVRSLNASPLVSLAPVSYLAKPRVVQRSRTGLGRHHVVELHDQVPADDQPSLVKEIAR
jgi:hypothetical protein